MRKLLSIIIMILASASSAMAQTGLYSNAVFKGKIVPKRQMVVTEVRGAGMSTYRLDYYHGVQFHTDMASVNKVAALVSADILAADSAETEKVDGILTYALVRLKPYRKVRRYLCYQARLAGSSWIITVLYLEGDATPEDLRNMFETQ